MKLFDARWIGSHGIGRFAAEIRDRLTGFRDAGLRGSPAAALDPLRLAVHLRAVAPQLFFSPGYNPPLGAPCPFVFCLHDLNHLFVPENSTALKRAYYSRLVRPAVHRAERVLTVSEFSRHAICEWARVSPSRIINVGNGVSQAFRPEGRVYDQLHRPYLLHVGSHKPHKNLRRVLRAFSTSGLPSELMFVSTGSATPELRRLASELRLSERLSFIGRASEALLAELYRGAVALVLASTYEGFGLPIIEAMACGTPVVTSNVASMPEVAGDAAVLANPYDVDSIGDALRRVATDEALRFELKRRGLERARRYSWDDTARKIQSALGDLSAACSRSGETKRTRAVTAARSSGPER